MDKTIKLPSREQMIARLMKVNTTPFLVKNLYPRIAQRSGEEFTAKQLATFLEISVTDFCIDFKLLLSIVASLQKTIPQWIEALIDDEEARKEVLEEYQKGQKKN